MTTRALFAAAFLSAALSAQPLPFELLKDVVFVKASIGNSAPLEMALDSGTIRTTLDEAVARRLGFDLSMKAQSSGANGTQEISILKDQTLQFAAVQVTEPLMLVYSLEFLSKVVGRRIDGIIGIELFRKYVVELDYPGRKIRILDPAGFKYAGAGESVPVTYYGRLPLVEGSVTPFGGSAVTTKFQLDTGGSGLAVDLWKDFVAQHSLLAGARDLVDVPSTVFTGTRMQKKGRIQAIQIGRLKVDEPEVRFNDFNFGTPDAFGGNLGSGFFRQFRIIFDLPHDRVIFERPDRT